LSRRVRRIPARYYPLAAVVAAALWAVAPKTETPPELPHAARVTRAVDGDTVELGRGRLVRYIGVDTPEVRRRDGERWVKDPEPFGEEAAEFNRRLVAGRRVRLEYDVQTRDRFNRLLAYVYVPDDRGEELMVNEALLREGFAQPMTIPPNVRHAAAFRALADEARRNRRGLWARE
jgi:micrococcal nuclease